MKAYAAGDTATMLREVGKMEEASITVLANLEQMVHSAELNADMLCSSAH